MGRMLWKREKEGAEEEGERQGERAGERAVVSNDIIENTLYKF